MSVIPDSYFDCFTTPKYRNRNLLQRLLIRRFATRLLALVEAARPEKGIVEIGCGQGFITGQLAAAWPELKIFGVDINPTDLTHLRQRFPRVEAIEGDIYDLSVVPATPDLVICCEVLEHLAEPARALDQMLRLVEDEPARFVLSVPHEPWFQLSNLLRGKNLSRLGNDPEHVQRWGCGGFRRLLAGRFVVRRSVTSYPWQMVLAERG